MKEEEEPIIIVQRLQEKHVDSSAKVLTRNFMNKYKMHKQNHLSFDQIIPIMRGKIVRALPSCASFVLLQNQNLIGVFLNYDITELKNFPNMPNTLQIFNEIRKIDTQLQNGINSGQIKRGEGLYGAFDLEMIDPQYSSQDYSLKFFWEGLTANKISGYKTYFSKVTSEESLQFLYKLGANLICEKIYQLNGIKQKYWVVRLQLKNGFPSYSSLKKMIKQEPKPKL